MSHAFMPATILLLVGATMSASIILYAWRLRRTSVGPAFIGLMLCITIYATGYAFELTCGTLEGMLFWNKIQYLGIPFIPAFWLILAARYAGRDAWLTRPMTAILFALSALTLVMNYTNGGHHLFYKSVGIDDNGSFPVISLIWGPAYFFQVAYVNISLIAGNVLLFSALRRAAPHFRRQAAVVMAGTALPWLGYLIYVSGLSPRELDVTAIALTLATPFLAWGLFRYRLLDFAPVAKESVFASMEDGAVVLDIENRIVDFNQAARRILPGLAAKVLGRPVRDVLGDAPKIAALLDPGGSKTADMKTVAGSSIGFFRAGVSPVLNRRGREMARILLLHDITEQVRMTEKLRELATTDDLTGAFNRRHFFSLGQAEIERAKRYGHSLSVIILDLDHFKRINDTWGHEGGDRVLRAASEAFRVVLRTSDRFARYGGEEFAILLPETPLAEARRAAERMRTTISRCLIEVAGGERIRITASIGVAGVDRVGKLTLDGLIRAADRAMYAAKEAGRDRVFVNEDAIVD
jgi:diguanylate cyclase (GGDEF)-like protein